MAGEMMIAAKPFIERNIHPTIIVSAYHKALTFSLDILKQIAIEIDINDEEQMKNNIKCCIGTKFASRWGGLVVDLAYNSV